MRFISLHVGLLTAAVAGCVGDPGGGERQRHVARVLSNPAAS